MATYRILTRKITQHTPSVEFQSPPAPSVELQASFLDNGESGKKKRLATRLWKDLDELVRPMLTVS